jgi:hypothetical protein
MPMDAETLKQIADAVWANAPAGTPLAEIAEAVWGAAPVEVVTTPGRLDKERVYVAVIPPSDMPTQIRYVVGVDGSVKTFAKRLTDAPEAGV